MKKIVSLAMNPAIDKSSSVEHVIAERKLYCKPPRFEPGGGGVNVSRAIKKLGGDSLLLYPAGGYTGQRLKDLLEEEGITHRAGFHRGNDPGESCGPGGIHRPAISLRNAGAGSEE